MLRVVAHWSALRRCVVSAARCLATGRPPGVLIGAPLLLTTRTSPYLQPIRSKAKKAKSKGTQQPGDNEKIAYVSSLRIDSIMKAGVNLSKTKVAESFYNGSIRLNGRKVTKKSTQVSVGDEVDHILELSAQNPNFMEVDRVTLLATHHDRVTDKGRFQVRLHCQRRLVIEKYADED
ncbi:hypothetical protein MRX96_004159 [Rhipicephalus microplus]